MEALAVGELLNLAQESSGGWAGFWGTLWSGEWLANVGLPLAATVGAIAVAYFALRRQLKHDRQLALEEHRRVAALRLAACLRSVSADLWGFFDEDRAAPPERETGRWVTAVIGPASELRRAISAARLVLGDAATLRRIDTHCVGMISRWQAWTRFGASVAGQYPFPDIRVALGMVAARDPAILVEFAAVLESWDGRGDVPPVGQIAGLDACPEAPSTIGDDQSDEAVTARQRAYAAWREARDNDVRGYLDNEFWFPARVLRGES